MAFECEPISPYNHYSDTTTDNLRISYAVNKVAETAIVLYVANLPNTKKNANFEVTDRMSGVETR